MSQNHDHESHNGNFDIHAAARRVLLAAKFEPDINQAAHKQLDALASPAPMPTGVRDLRQLPWSSIDNTESRDLDQVEVAEALPDGSIKLIVGIADVDSLVPKGSPIDEHALANCTSVYTGIDVFPMLPEKLSTDWTSLNEGEDRLAMVVDMSFRADATLTASDIYRAAVRNKAKLAYDSVSVGLTGGAWPEDDTSNTGPSSPHTSDRSRGRGTSPTPDEPTGRTRRRRGT